MSLPWLQTLKTDFLMTRLIFKNIKQVFWLIYIHCHRCLFQIEKYLENERYLRETEKISKDKKKNRKGTAVHFGANFLLQDAVDNFDDREGSLMSTAVNNLSRIHDKPACAIYTNNKDTNKPAHLHSLISAFVVPCLDCIILILANCKISRS